MNSRDNNKLQAAFGARLKQLRTARKLSLQALADACGMDISQVHRIERGRQNPTLGTMQALANGLDVSLSLLLKTL